MLAPRARAWGLNARLMLEILWKWLLVLGSSPLGSYAREHARLVAISGFLPSNMGDDLPSPFAWPIFAARGGEEAVKHEGDAEFVHGEEEAR